MATGELLAASTAATSTINSMRERIDLELRGFVDGRSAAFTTTTGLSEVFQLTRDFLLRGGKRLRPLFCYTGWLGAGGEPTSRGIVTAAASLEVFHAFALIHDDIMDRGAVRRGQPALHRAMADLHRQWGWAGDTDHAGRSLGILAGDLCFSWSGNMLHSCGLPVSRVRAAQTLLHRMHTEVARGQYLDLLGQGIGTSPSDAMEIVLHKAAKYTVERPLQIGGVLTGADRAVLDSYREFGVPLGEAFQLRDDLLGVFGDASRTGKSTVDDLRGGKPTVLIALTRERATEVDQARIERLYGNPDLDEEDAAALREIMIRTGGKAGVERMIVERVERADRALAQAPVTEDARVVLGRLAEAATTRTS